MGKKKKTHRRWPQGFPSGLYLGRSQGFAAPSGVQRQAATMQHAIESFKYVGIGAPDFGAKKEP